RTRRPPARRARESRSSERWSSRLRPPVTLVAPGVYVIVYDAELVMHHERPVTVHLDRTAVGVLHQVRHDSGCFGVTDGEPAVLREQLPDSGGLHQARRNPRALREMPPTRGGTLHAHLRVLGVLLGILVHRVRGLPR